MSLPRTLHIVYRHVHISAEARSRDPGKSRPEWFSYETCFRNLLQTVRADPLAHRVRIVVLFDGTREEFEDDFVAGYHANPGLNISVQFTRGGSNGASFLVALEMVRTSPIPETDLVYFLENDYLHQPGWVSKLFELYDSPLGVGIVSLYDHGDKYFLPMYADLQSRIVHTPTHHWRTAPSTCGTFVLSKAAVLQDYDLWTSNLYDYVLFPEAIRRGRLLLTPVPGLATHAMTGYLSPTIDWAQRAREAWEGDFIP